MVRTAVCAMLAAGLMLAAAGVAAGAEKMEPIKTVTIGENRELVVNGKPFFLIMSWAQSPKRYASLPDVGFNAHCGGNGDPSSAKAVGVYSIPAFNPAYVENDYVLGWIQGDEPDMPQKEGGPKRTPEAVVEKYVEIKKADQKRPVLMTFTGNFTK